ncbi:MAG: alpha/beta hydrolase [Acidobacteriota bacterium]|nr:alpha/beta hydrolase [Acidobacteriota bacterium]
MRLQIRGRELFALHRAPEGGSRLHAVVLCNPFGQEAIRAHRLYRVLGDRLAAAGFEVVRFDYFGSGDSAGDDEAFDLLGAVNDAVGVAEWTWARGHATRLSLLGLRLGGSVAMLASSRLTTPPSHLVLFEPVLDGARYLEQLVSNNERTLTEIFGSRWKIDPNLRVRNLPPEGEYESLGFVLGQGLRHQLGELLPMARPWQGRCAYALALTREVPQLAHWQACAGSTRLNVREAASEIDWATNSAVNTAIVPMHWIEQTLEFLQGTSAYA